MKDYEDSHIALERWYEIGYIFIRWVATHKDYDKIVMVHPKNA